MHDIYIPNIVILSLSLKDTIKSVPSCCAVVRCGYSPPLTPALQLSPGPHDTHSSMSVTEAWAAFPSLRVSVKQQEVNDKSFK